MLASKLYAPTLRETPADADVSVNSICCVPV